MSTGALNPKQFTGAPLYHGTTKAAAEAITQTGLRASWSGNYTLTPDRAVAEDYSRNGWSPDEGGAVVEVRLPPRVHHGYVSHLADPDAEEAMGEAPRNDGMAWLRRDVPPKYVKRVL